MAAIVGASLLAGPLRRIAVYARARQMGRPAYTV